MGKLCQGEAMGGDGLVTDLRSFKRYLLVCKNNDPYINYYVLIGVAQRDRIFKKMKNTA